MEFFRYLFMRTNKRLMEAQVEVYLQWGRRNSIASIDYTQWFELFLASTDKTDVLDFTLDDVDFFVKNCQDIRTKYQEESARKAVTSLLRFYMARSKNGKGKLKGGRPPHLGEIAKVQNYRKLRPTPLSFRDIAKLMGKPIALVHRWSRYPLKTRE